MSRVSITQSSLHVTDEVRSRDHGATRRLKAPNFLNVPRHTGLWLREGSGSAQLFVATRVLMWIATLVVNFPRYIMVGVLIATECGDTRKAANLAMQ